MRFRFRYSLLTMLLFIGLAPAVFWLWWSRTVSCESFVYRGELQWRGQWRDVLKLEQKFVDGRWRFEDLRETCPMHRGPDGRWVRHGVSVLSDSAGHRLREQHWRNDQAHGPWVDWDFKHPNTKLAEGEYKNGLKHGTWRKYKESECVAIDVYANDVPITATTIFPGFNKSTVRSFENGGLRLTERYHRSHVIQTPILNGVPHGTELWRNSSSSPPYLEINFEYGLRHGSFIRWYSDHQPAFEGHWEHGLEEGKLCVWDDRDGSVVASWQFRKGCLVRPTGQVLPSIFPPGETSIGNPNLQRIRLALGMTLDEYFSFSDGMLNDAVTDLSQKCDIPVLVHDRARAAVGVSDLRVNLSGYSPLLTYHSAIQIMLEPLGLVAVFRHNMLVVTSIQDRIEWTDRSGLPQILAGASSELASIFNSPAEFEFERTSLTDALAQIHEKYRLEFRIDQAAFQGGPSPSEISVYFYSPTRVRLIDVLSMWCDEHELACVNEGGVLVFRPANMKHTVSGDSSKYTTKSNYDQG